MIRRPPRSTLSSSSAASDVYKRQALRVEGVRRAAGGVIDRDRHFPAAVVEVGLQGGGEGKGRGGDPCPPPPVSPSLGDRRGVHGHRQSEGAAQEIVGDNTGRERTGEDLTGRQLPERHRGAL